MPARVDDLIRDLGSTRCWTLLFGKDPSSVLHRSPDILADLLTDLRELGTLADSYAGRCRSAGLRTMFDTIHTELPDDYFPLAEDHLQRLQFPTGVVMTATIGPSGQGSGQVLLKPHTIRRSWRQVVHLSAPDSYTWRRPDRDEAGARAMSEPEAVGINLLADALAQSVDHIRGLFALLQFETAFYRGCVRLHDELNRRSLPTCRPEPRPTDELALIALDLYEVNLGLHLGRRVVTNDLADDGASTIMFTGTNHGGKSTTPRALGLAQLLMQSGSIVPGRDYRASVTVELFSHYCREEDATMASGKLDEELARMSRIVDQLQPGALLLLEESFAATNEREGSAIGRHIVDGLRAAGIRIAYVTHLYDLAAGLHRDEDRGGPGGSAVFLRPERLDDTARTFRLLPGKPQPTSYGPGLYRRIFGDPQNSAETPKRLQKQESLQKGT